MGAPDRVVTAFELFRCDTESTPTWQSTGHVERATEKWREAKMLDLVGTRAVKMFSFSRLAAGAVALAIAWSGTAARAQGPVLPLPASDQQQIAAHLGAGVVGAALPSERILDALSYFPLQEKTLTFQVTSGRNAGNTQNLNLKKARRPARSCGASASRPHWPDSSTPRRAAVSSCRR